MSTDHNSGEAGSAALSLSPRLRFLPLSGPCLRLIAFFASGLQRYVTFATLADHRATLLAWVAAQPFLAALIYVLSYIAIVAFSLPGGALLTLTGGFLFGTVAGGICALVGATIGAT